MNPMNQLLLPGLEGSDAAALAREMADQGCLQRVQLDYATVEWGLASTKRIEPVWSAFVTVKYRDKRGDEHITGAHGKSSADPIEALTDALSKAQARHRESQEVAA